jgi:hypothetical protein
MPSNEKGDTHDPAGGLRKEGTKKAHKEDNV